MISYFKVKTTKRFYCWILIHVCILSKCVQMKSNTLPNAFTAEHSAQSYSTIDDKHSVPLSSPENVSQYMNHEIQKIQKTSHHFSVNRRRLNDIPMSRHEQQKQKHHNLVVSYENIIDKSVSKIYNFDSYNNTNSEDNFNQLLTKSNNTTPNINIRETINDDISFKNLFRDDPSLKSMMNDGSLTNDNGKRREKRFTRSSFEFEKNVDEFVVDEPYLLPLRPIVRGPFDGDAQNLDEVAILYVESRSQIKLNCEVDLDIQTSVWLKDGQIVQAVEAGTRTNEFRFIKEPRGGLTINNVMLEDDGHWQCEAENFRGYMETGRLTKLVVLSTPRPPYLTYDSRRLDASNLFIPVKENAEISLSCVSEGGNPKPLLSWEILLNPSVDHHSLKLPSDSLEVQVVKSKENEKDYKINSGAKSDAKLPVIYRAHHNARVLCVMEHPSLKMRQNASIVLDVQYTPSFAITRTPGFGYPLREGIPVSLKCDVDSNPSSSAIWQKDDGDPPIPQSEGGLLNFTAIRREHSGWYKCTARHLNKPYSSFGYFLNVRYDAIDVTSEPEEQNLAIASSSSLTQSKMPLVAHSTSKFSQMEVELGGSVTLQCPQEMNFQLQGSLGCWSHLDPITSRLKGVGVGTYPPNSHYSLKDVIYQDAGIYKCVGQNPTNKKKLEVLNTIALGVKGFPTVTAKNTTPSAFPGSPLHLVVEFCANPPAYAARWLHGDKVYTPGNQYGVDVLAYSVTDLPIPFCKEARLTVVHMHEKVPREFYFIVSTPTGVAEAIINVNFISRDEGKNFGVDAQINNNLPIFSSSAKGLESFMVILIIVNLK
ncbi:CLUMA_CG020961, isoform A, partial [Clunio marinus]